MTTAELSKSEEIIRRVESLNTNKVRVAVVDIDGILRGKIIHIDKFRNIFQSGFGFCDVVFGWDANDQCYDNTQFTGWHKGYPDSTVRLDYETFRQIPWEKGMPFFLGDFYTKEGEPLEIEPRNLLKKIRSQSLKLGYAPIFSQEYEWFNFQETSDELHARQFQNPTPITNGMFGYSILRSSQNSPFFNDLFDQLALFRIPLEGLHTETGPGVYEAAIIFDDILEAADRSVLFKSSVKEIGYRHGIMPTFMAKWNNRLPGCGGHIHQSLWKGEGYAFYDAKQPHQMSKIMQHYLAGILHCMPYVTPMYAPTINSYKRLVEGFWAPTTATWGVDNRTTAVRVIPGNVKSTRIELRLTGSDMNPYLAMAACLASGLYGIRNQLELKQPPSTGNACNHKNCGVLPRTLAQATELMEKSEIAYELFGSEFVTHFIQTREWELNQYAAAITDWEFKRYFEII